MAYRRGMRDPYEARFPADSREVTVHRVVNIVEKRPRPLVEYDRGYNDDPWYGDTRHYQDTREYHGEGSYSHNDRRYYDDNSNGHYRRNSPQHEGPYSHLSYGRDDLRHQLGSRNSGRGGPYFRSRGRASGPRRRSSPQIVIKRDRSPIRRESQPPVPVRSGSNTSTIPDREKSLTYQQTQQRHKPSVQTSHTPSSSVEESPHPSGSAKEKTQTASVAETVEEEEEVEGVEEVEELEKMVSASMEPKPTPEEDFKARRLEAIKAKALEIEKHYRADCETFRTVVKMLVDKEPSLDNLLQAPLDKNLSEIKERCLESLRHFVKELDEVLKQPDTSA